MSANLVAYLGSVSEQLGIRVCTLLCYQLTVVGPEEG